MKELLELGQIERQLIVYDVFLTFDQITYGDIRFVLEKFERRTLQRDIRDLIDAGLLLVKYNKRENAYEHMGDPTGEINYRNGISNKKIQHLKRLQRLAGCMTLISESDPVGTYFKMFPQASERMRQRDFETPRNIGFEAGYNRHYKNFEVINNMNGPYDGYGIFIENGKMMRYL